MTGLRRRSVLATVVLAGLAVGGTRPGTRPSAGQTSQPAGAVQPGTEPATAPSTQVAVVRWQRDFDSASAEARQRGVLLVIVLFDPESPTCLSYNEQTLSRLPVRQHLADFAAAWIDCTTEDGKNRLAATGQKEPPVTQVWSPTGELLDAAPGAIVPPSKLIEWLGRSVRYWNAGARKPSSAAERWEAVQARLELSTRDKALPEIDALLLLPGKDLPEGATPPRLWAARGLAEWPAAADKAEKSFRKALELGPKDPRAGGTALARLGDLAVARKEYRQGHALYEQYLGEFPTGPDAGAVCIAKAMLELLPLDDRAAAHRTLSEFIRTHPDDPTVVRARELLKMAEPPATTRSAP